MSFKANKSLEILCFHTGVLQPPLTNGVRYLFKMSVHCAYMLLWNIHLPIKIMIKNASWLSGNRQWCDCERLPRKNPLGIRFTELYWIRIRWRTSWQYLKRIFSSSGMFFLSDDCLVLFQVYTQAAVVTDVARCTSLGFDVLGKRGSSVDAAIAASLCLGIVHPHTSGIGGYECQLLTFTNDQKLWEFYKTCEKCREL